jgi:MOSC domain-containing protein YiiM
MSGVLEAIWRKRAHGGPMDPLPEALLVAGVGLEGNADRGGLRQVTLIEAETFETVSALLGRSVDPVARRANLLVRGIDLVETRGRILAVGATRIRIHGETRPCGVMDAAVPGLRQALAESWRGGAFGEVLQGGSIRVGDRTFWVEGEPGSDANPS